MPPLIQPRRPLTPKGTLHRDFHHFLRERRGKGLGRKSEGVLFLGPQAEPHGGRESESRRFQVLNQMHVVVFCQRVAFLC